MPIDLATKALRLKVRKNYRTIIQNLSQKYLGPIDLIETTKCSFCGTTEDLTKEHVLPLWIFDSLQNAFYINQWNLQRRNYVDSTIPACRTCNNETLNEIERHIKFLFLNKKVGTRSYTSDDYQNIIRWLEIINYKFQVHDLMQKFVRQKNTKMIECLKDLSLAMMMGFPTSFQIEVKLRKALKRISVKNKENRIGSLMFAKDKNKGLGFFNGDDFIFLGLPHYGLALFYFYKREFKSERSAQAAFRKILNHALPTDQN